MNEIKLKTLKKYKQGNRNILQAVIENVDYLILYTPQGVLDINLKGKRTIYTNDKKWGCSNDKEYLKEMKLIEKKMKILDSLDKMNKN